MVSSTPLYYILQVRFGVMFDQKVIGLASFTDTSRRKELLWEG